MPHSTTYAANAILPSFVETALALAMLAYPGTCNWAIGTVYSFVLLIGINPQSVMESSLSRHPTFVLRQHPTLSGSQTTTLSTVGTVVSPFKSPWLDDCKSPRIRHS